MIKLNNAQFLFISLIVGSILSFFGGVIFDCYKSPSNLGDDQEKGEVAETCRIVAAMRALDSTRNSSYKNVDPLSEYLAGEEIMRMVKTEYPNLFDLRPYYDYLGGIAIRGLAIEGRIMNKSSEVKQIVVVGAGMDTRPYRLDLPNIRWFEVDMPEVLDLKKKLIENTPKELKKHVKKMKVKSLTSVKINLKGHLLDLIPTMEKQGFDKNLPTIYIMEGFVPYLTIQELKILFNEIPRVKGSRIIATVVTFATRKLLVNPFIRYLFTKILNIYTYDKMAPLWQNDVFSISFSNAFLPWKVEKSINMGTEMYLNKKISLPKTKFSFLLNPTRTIEDIYDLVPDF